MPYTVTPLRLDLRHAAVALLAGALIGAVLAAAVGRQESTYQSKAVLAIDQPLAIAASGSGGVVEKLSRLRGKYAGLVRTNVIAEPVASSTGQPVGAVRQALFAAADDTSLLLTVGARATDQQLAQRLAKVAGDEVVAYAAAEQARFAIPEQQRFTFDVVVPAGTATSSTPERSRQVRVGFIGLVVGALLVYAVLELIATERRR